MSLILALIGVIASIFVPWVTLAVSLILYVVIFCVKYPESDNLVAAIFHRKGIHFCLNTVVLLTSLVALGVHYLT